MWRTRSFFHGRYIQKTLHYFELEDIVIVQPTLSLFLQRVKCYFLLELSRWLLQGVILKVLGWIVRSISFSKAFFLSFLKVIYIFTDYLEMQQSVSTLKT